MLTVIALVLQAGDSDGDLGSQEDDDDYDADEGDDDCRSLSPFPRLLRLLACALLTRASDTQRRR